MKFIFKGGGELVEVEAIKDDLYIKSSMTNQKLLKFSPKIYNDRKMRHLAKIMLSRYKTVNERDKKVYIIMQFKLLGYSLHKFIGG